MKKTILFASLCLIANSSFAQPGPGMIGGMGKGIVDGLYNKVWDDAQSGKLETMDKPPLFEQMVLA